MDESNNEVKQDKPEPSVRELLEKVIENQNSLATEKKVSKWKLPWGARVGTGQVKKGWATFCLIRENGEVDFVKAPIDNLTAKIDGFPRLATPEYRLTHKNKPFYIIPSWSMKPFSPIENYNEVEKVKMHIAGRRVVLAQLEGEQIKPKGKGFGGMGWILLGIGVIAILYYLGKNAGWF